MSRLNRFFFPQCNRQKFIITLSVFIFILMIITTVLQAGALEKYIQQKDSGFTWKCAGHKEFLDATVTHIEIASQTWRDLRWNHHLQILRPKVIRNTEMAFLFVTGDGDGTKYIESLYFIASKAGTVAAVITDIPNQPLFHDLREDALIAYTFDQYLKTKDESWPLLFPMVKSVVRGMDAIQAFMQNEFEQNVNAFVISGASKRGWTTWLAAAVDPRVKGIAPMVFDMLNMRKQTDWAEKIYGRQSEKIIDYTERNLVDRMEEPDMVTLEGWVDPYNYRNRYTMPKLILLGTNDSYWVVDSLRHYWNELPEPKLLYQTPNAGHNLNGGKDATQTLTIWYQIIANGHELPKVNWHLSNGSDGPAGISVTVSELPKKARLWMASSEDRDFRNDIWLSQELEIKSNGYQAAADIPVPKKGFKAFMGEVELISPAGDAYRLSTRVQVTPDNISPPE